MCIRDRYTNVGVEPGTVLTHGTSTKASGGEEESDDTVCTRRYLLLEGIEEDRSIDGVEGFREVESNHTEGVLVLFD